MYREQLTGKLVDGKMNIKVQEQVSSTKRVECKVSSEQNKIICQFECFSIEKCIENQCS